MDLLGSDVDEKIIFLVGILEYLAYLCLAFLLVEVEIVFFVHGFGLLFLFSFGETGRLGEVVVGAGRARGEPDGGAVVPVVDDVEVVGEVDESLSVGVG